VIEEFYRAKFGICAIEQTKLERDDVDYLFGDVASVSTDVVAEKEFNKGDSVLLVLEKQGGLVEAMEMVGRIQVKAEEDFTKTKRKQKDSFFVGS